MATAGEAPAEGAKKAASFLKGVADKFSKKE